MFQENGLFAHKSGPSHIVSLSDESVREEYREVQSPFRPFMSCTPSESSDTQSVRPVSLTHNPQQQPGSDPKDESFDLQLPFPVTIPRFRLS